MSNEVYGYIVSNSVSDWGCFFKAIEETTGLGIALISDKELYNFPESMLPEESTPHASFIIGDRPRKKNATYLIDYQNYAPEANIGSPIDAGSRLRLLTSMFLTLVKESNAERFVVAITECSQIDEFKQVPIENMHELIVGDFEKYYPPDVAYEIIIS
jgi:hypothetical protein